MDGLDGLDGLGGLHLRLTMIMTGLSMAMNRLTRMRLRLSMVMSRSLGLCLMPRIVRRMMTRTLGVGHGCRGQDGECCQYVFHCCSYGMNGLGHDKSTQWI